MRLKKDSSENGRPKRSLFIAATARSGSSFFCAALSTTKSVGRINEWLSPPNVGPQNLKPYPFWKEDYGRYLRELSRREQSAEGVFSSKVMFSHLNSFAANLGHEPKRMSDKKLLKLLETFFPNPRFILIQRRNKTSQGVSFAKALQTRVWNNFGRRKAYDGSRVQFNYPTIQRIISVVLAEEERWRVFLKNTGAPYREVVHEEFSANYEQNIEDLLDWFGVEPVVPVDRERNLHRKMADSINKAWKEEVQNIQNRLQELDDAAIEEAATVPVDGRLSLADEGVTEMEAGSMAWVPTRLFNATEKPFLPFGREDGTGWITVRHRWFRDGQEVTEQNLSFLASNLSMLRLRVEPQSEVGLNNLVHVPAQPGAYTLQLEAGHETFQDDERPIKLQVPVTVKPQAVPAPAQ